MSLSALNTGLSGLKAYQGALDSSAHNIANAGTPGFSPQQATFQEANTGGVLVTISQQGSTASKESSTDLADELVNSMQDQLGFDFSAKIIKTMDAVLGTLIDIKA
jgi:flagellar hook protein FlgE